MRLQPAARFAWGAVSGILAAGPEVDEGELLALGLELGDHRQVEAQLLGRESAQGAHHPHPLGKLDYERGVGTLVTPAGIDRVVGYGPGEYAPAAAGRYPLEIL